MPLSNLIIFLIRKLPLNTLANLRLATTVAKHICGDGKGLTRTGIPVHPGLISVDSCVIPLGSTVIIDGIEYQAEDTGGMIKGNKIDMAVETHHEALDLGVYWADVYIIGTK